MSNQQVPNKDELYLRQLALPLLGKWSIFLILALSEKEMYFAELERTLTGISRKVLSKTLQELVDCQILYKKGVASTGHKTYYGLTPLGQSLLPLIYQLKEWIREHRHQLENKYGRKTQIDTNE